MMSPEEILTVLKTPKSIMSQESSPISNFSQCESLKQSLDDRYHFLQNKTQQEAQKRVINQLSFIMRDWSHDVRHSSRLPARMGFQRKISINLKPSCSLLARTILACARKMATLMQGLKQAIVVVPNSFDRDEHFYGDLHDLLSKKSNVSQLKCVASAKVPILKMMIDNGKGFKQFLWICPSRNWICKSFPRGQSFLIIRFWLIWITSRC